MKPLAFSLSSSLSLALALPLLASAPVAVHAQQVATVTPGKQVVDNGTFWSALQGSVDFWDDFGVALLKSAVFGGTAALVASYAGFHAEPTIEGTSVATTRAVVNASLLVLMLNFVMSALLFR